MLQGEREKNGTRTVKKLKKTKTREGKKRAEEREGVRAPKPDAEQGFERKTSDFPISSPKYFDKELGIYQTGKQEKQKLSSRDPRLLEFNDLIQYKVARSDYLSCLNFMASGPLFSQQHRPHHYQVGSKEQRMGGKVWILGLENIFLNPCRFSCSILLVAYLSS